MNLTPRELELLANTDVLGYIQTRNAERNAQAQAEGWTFWTTMPESEDFIAEYANVYELEHMYACGTYSDVYKESYCHRPRHKYGKWTLAQLEAAIDEMCLSEDEDILSEDIVEANLNPVSTLADVWPKS